MFKRSWRNEAGIVAFAPLFIIAAALLLTLTFKSLDKDGTLINTQNVLSESEDGDEDRSGSSEDGDDEESSDDNRSGSENRVSTQTRVRVEANGDAEDENEVEDEIEEEIEIEDEEDGTRSARIKIRSRDGEFEFEAEGVSARSNFPVSVNSETNELIITTPSGERVVTVLPDQAVENMIENGVIDQSLSIEIQDGQTEVEYEIDGVDEQKLLGLFRIAIARRARVSAENGEVLSVEQDLLSRFLDFLSV